MGGFNDLMLPPHALPRDDRARAPKPVELGGQLYDVMGVSLEGELVLRDQRAMHQDVRIEHFAGRPAMFKGIRYRVVSLKATTGPLDATLELIDPRNPSRVLTITSADTMCVQFPGTNGEHKLGLVKHGMMRMAPVASRAEVRMPLWPGQCFEAHLCDHELDGPYTIKVGDGGRLVATGVNRNGNQQCIAIEPAEVAPRYRTVMSLDFGANFDVDAFLFREDQLHSQATIVGPDPGYGHLQDPLFGCLPSGTSPRLSNGAEHLAVYEKFIRDNIQPDAYMRIAGAPRKLTIFNLSVCNQGDARGVLDALVGFRLQNIDAEMSIVASKLGPSEFQETLEFCEYLKILAVNDIHINMFTGTDCPTRQVMHAKGIVIDSKVLFSTAAVMDTQPINKADFSIELPQTAARKFQLYTDEVINGKATDERRAELAAELAKLGVVINDPVTRLTYISRAQDALIRSATDQLIVSVSELVDPAITQALIDRAASGVQVIIQVRELDPVSALLLAGAMLRGSNLLVENSSWWEPRPHFNAIIADGGFAYLGTSYLWPTQRNMVHHSRSLENGVLLHGDAAARVLVQIEDLCAQAHGFTAISRPRKQKVSDPLVLNRCGLSQSALAAV